MNSQKEYWLRQFEGTIPVLDMPTDFPRSWPIGSEGDNVYFTINKELNHRLRILMRETGTTLYMVLLAVFNVLLLKHTGQQDMVVGSPITGRSHPDLQSIIGMFVNMLSMRNFPRKEKKFEDFLGEVKENALKAYQNQDFQFDELIRKVGLQGNIGRNPLFDVVFQLDNMDRGKMERGDFRMLPSGLGPHKVQFDLTLGGEEIGEEIRMYLVFATALFKRDTAKKLTKWYMEILEKVAKYKEIKLRDIKISHDRLAIKTGISPDDREDFGF
jgi:non-ribosomal peptide synthetase component F